MGTIAPLKISENLQSTINEKVVLPTLSELKKQKILFRGFIFFGLMINNDQPSLLEYNCRLGDPETQVILPLIEEDFGSILFDLAQGKVKALRLRNLMAACVVMAAPGYPLNPESRVVIEGDLDFATHTSYFLHAGSMLNKNQWLTKGGRVLNAIGLGSTYQEALKNAYAQASKVSWRGMQMRSDIGFSISTSSTSIKQS